MPKFVRARQGTGILRHPESGALAAPDPSRPVAADDPLVKAYPWAFVSDEDLAAELEATDVSWREGAIESARRADEAIAARQKMEDEQDADAVKMAEARAKGKPQGDDADPDNQRGVTELDDEDVEDATARPGEKSNARRTTKAAAKK